MDYVYFYMKLNLRNLLYVIFPIYSFRYFYSYIWVLIDLIYVIFLHS